ncbi:LEF-2 [Rachiplusia nu nucleopolyhedrovirus]|uniref:LEF-2 n=1 Tax=Rachiplusia nu nucleopolyhedrovirus TaxID=2605775 RepID=A0AAF1DB41_9ABAC|nr:LEF-2 [Rachiplusia nu nucleopolyhedrovirus]QEI03631.1 LEF-2 [Rachiplusia nu nucleopolyhedrovirus]
MLWTPLLSDIKNIQKDKSYKIRIDDFNVDLTAYTVFDEGGLTITISGTRLFYLMKNKQILEDSLEAQCVTNKKYRKSLKRICFDSISDKKTVVIVLKKHLPKMPPCMSNLLDELLIRPRGERFRKRFIFNCYIANSVFCKKCDRLCLQTAMSLLYENDDKCEREFCKLLDRGEDVYKPPNCNNMKNKEYLCPISGTCKGRNPICNF